MKTNISQDDLIFANRFGVLILNPVDAGSLCPECATPLVDNLCARCDIEYQPKAQETPKFSHLGGILFALCVGMAIWTGILWHWLK